MTHHRTHAVTGAVVALLVTLARPSFGEAQTIAAPSPMFEAGAQGKRSDRAQRRARRSRSVKVKLDALVSGRSRADQRVLLNLFDDVQVVARRRSVLAREGSAFVWKGRVESESGAVAEGDVNLVVRNGVLVGNVFMPGRSFEILYSRGGVQEVMELDPAAFPTEDPDVQVMPDLGGAAAIGSPSGSASATAAADASTQIDVMVVWTPAARAAAGGTSAMQSLVDLSVANANTTYANSQVNTSLRLVYSGEVNYTESSDVGIDLSRLASTDGYIDSVHTLRNTYAADVVSMLGRYSNVCGMGYLLPALNTFYAAQAFNVVEYSCAAGNLSYAHEVGHNQGLHHDPANASGTPVFSYAYGYQDPGGSFRTVMSYGGAPRVTRLSNPNLTYNGRVTGVANAQDNARALNNAAATVANFRVSGGSSCTYTVSPTTASFAATGGTSNVTVTTGSTCTWSVSNSTGWVTTSAASGTGSATVTLTASANTGSPRSGSLTIAGQGVSVSQAAAPCTYTVSPTSASFASGGSSAAVTISTAASCTWAVSNATGWVSTSAASGTGPATVTLTAAANTGAARSGSLTIAGQGVSVSQADAAAVCSYTVTPGTASFAKQGGSVPVAVTTATGCSWTVAEGMSWLTPDRTSGSGSGTLTLTVANNSTGLIRSGTVTVGGKAVTVSQTASPAPPKNPRVK